ncbi:hypothetical protein M9Y10_026733 [Tritrichomonas musculus]|uniref:DDE-1 domain-containing protein n=1 Tax=Tritrichomonas musculus TaxID=1915356 RepID=A0ABR2H6D8_9EUKA
MAKRKPLSQKDLLEEPDFDEKMKRKIEKIPTFHKCRKHNDNMSIVDALKECGIWNLLKFKAARKYFKKINQLFGVSKSSLYDWQKNLLDDPNWVPDHSKDPNISNVFTQKQHEELIEIIDSICESQNVPVTNLLIKEIARIYYNHLSYHPQPNLQFNASDHYITKLKKLLNYSRRRSHPERRPSAAKETINLFLQRCRYVFKNGKKTHIVNTDESFFRTTPDGMYTWAFKGSSDVIINVDGDSKEGFTYLGTISSDGVVFPLVLIAKGKSQVVENHWFGENHHISIDKNQNDTNVTFQTDHSQKGWTNSITWQHFLKDLRYHFLPPINNTNLYDRCNRIYLITDSYGAHDTKENDDFATSLNIDIIQIPEGLTFKFQPLDVLIFGIVKSKQTQFFNELYAQSIFQLFDPLKAVFREKIKVLKQMSKREATSTLLSIWKTITPYDVKLAFEKAISIYTDDLDDSNYSEDIEFEKKLQTLKGRLIDHDLIQETQQKIQEPKTIMEAVTSVFQNDETKRLSLESIINECSKYGNLPGPVEDLAPDRRIRYALELEAVTSVFQK